MSAKLPLDMIIRQAGPGDVSSLADLLVLTPDDGTMYQFPHIQEYAEDMHQLHVQWLSRAVHDPTTLIRVAVVPHGDIQKVVGFSSWMRFEIDPGSAYKTRAVKIADSIGVVPKDQEKQSDPEKSRSQSKALLPDRVHAEGVRRARKRMPPSPTLTVPCFELDGMGVHPDYQRRGIASLLVHWGVIRAREEGLPIFVTTENTGAEFYCKALGFQPLKDGEYWLDREGGDISRDEVENGNSSWQKSEGGLYGAQMVWVPDGCTFQA
ncbi:acyl-CoA N-acyltransferase [Xylariales sp. PMI_506]|nr:acyl-CoA N-acyltransferase [Xylariales sp. PMI_506]